MKVSHPTAPSSLVALQNQLNGRFQAQLATRDQTQVETAPLTQASQSSAHKVDVKA